MSSNWKTVKLGDFISIQSGLSYKGEFIGSGSNYLLGMGCVSNKEMFLDTGARLYSGEYKSQHIVDAGDIVLATRQQSDNLPILGMPAIIPNIFNGNKIIVGSNLYKVFNNSEIDNEFIYWLMKSFDYQNYIKSISTGTTVRMITKQNIENYTFKLPPINVRKLITKCLNTLNDKIELNRKMNQTLEAMANAIFKSWFVDFDPVHAKANCTDEAEFENIAKELGISKEILDLFPSEFIESELGMIPKGWEAIPLDEIANYQNGLALQKFRPKNENEFLPVLKIADLTRGYTDDEEKADINIKSECKVFNGDIIFSWSGTLLVDIWCGGNAALNQHLFKVTSETYSKWFYYYWTKQHLANFQHIAASKAVTMGHIKRSHLTEAICFVPNETLFAHAEKILSPLVEKQIINKLEIFELQKTRDTLLPKLLSGEIDVTDLSLEME